MKEWPRRVRVSAERTYSVHLCGDTFEITMRISTPRRSGFYCSKILVFLDDPLRGSRGVWIRGIDHLQAMRLSMEVVSVEIQRLHQIKGADIRFLGESSVPEI
jgi:hypothetical protein